MSSKKNNGNTALGCFGGFIGLVLSFPLSLIIAEKVILHDLECNPPDSDCNGIVAFTRAINNGILTFIIITIVGGSELFELIIGGLISGWRSALLVRSAQSLLEPTTFDHTRSLMAFLP